MSHAPVVLASTSSYRREQLARLGLVFECQAPLVDETTTAATPPALRADMLALRKADAVAATRQRGLVIGADQVATCQGRILHKPGSVERACEQLAACAGRDAVFHTAVALVNAASGEKAAARVDVRVRFRDLTRSEIARYVAADRPLDCAGSIRAEGLGITLLEGVYCDDPSAIVGLPLIALCRLLRAAGVALPGPVNGA